MVEMNNLELNACSFSKGSLLVLSLHTLENLNKLWNIADKLVWVYLATDKIIRNVRKKWRDEMIQSVTNLQNVF